MKPGILVLLSLICLPVQAQLPAPGAPGAPADSRYCGEPARDGFGRIKRDYKARDRFIATWPKPADGREWHVDHVIPLVNGGCDLPHNMQWLPTDIKSCGQPTCKDRWERKVYSTP